MSVASVLAVAFFVLLLLAFPRRMMILLAVVAVVGVVIASVLFGVEAYQNQQRERLNNGLQFVVYFDTRDCMAEYPLRVEITNRTDRTMNAVSFTLSGYRKSYSKPLRSEYTSNYDRIIGSRESYVSCWRVPRPDIGITDDVLASNLPSSLEWRIDSVSGDFD